MEEHSLLSITDVSSYPLMPLAFPHTFLLIPKTFTVPLHIQSQPFLSIALTRVTYV